MAGPGPDERVGDAERERAVALLAEHCAAGRFDLDEMGRRAALAHAARTRDELEAVLADLPGAVPAEADLPWRERPPRRGLRRRLGRRR